MHRMDSRSCNLAACWRIRAGCKKKEAKKNILGNCVSQKWKSDQDVFQQLIYQVAPAAI
jgi:hypothetical protein